MRVSKRIVLHFPRRMVDRPIVSRLVRDFNLDFNILKASVTPEEEGLMVLELSGEQENYDKGVRYLNTGTWTERPVYCIHVKATEMNLKMIEDLSRN